MPNRTNQAPFVSPYMQKQPQDVQDRFAQESPARQPIIAQVLQGSLQAPEAGKEMTDPYMRGLLTAAIRVKPTTLNGNQTSIAYTGLDSGIVRGISRATTGSNTGSA
jgi:hypothetical protein